MSSYRIGVDIDGTVTDPATFIPYLNQAFNKNLSFDQITQYHLAPLYGITEEQFLEWFLKSEGLIYAAADPAAGAPEVLKAWKKQHQLIFISARHVNHYQLTLDWFHKHDLPYHCIDLLGSHRKVEKAQEHNVDLFLEDKLDNANELAEELDIPIILFDTPYNQGSSHQRVHRVHHWNEARTIVDSM